MAIDTPATLAILGAGPIGLEAALYARFLGYRVDIYEQGDVAQNVRAWGHARMFSPFSFNCSPLGVAALQAQLPNYEPPEPEALLTGAEWIEQYLLPLAQTDLLSDGLHLHTEVVAVSRDVFLKGDHPGDENRGDDTFRILVRDANQTESIHEADAVIDATGVYLQPNYLGPGGAPAMGELRCREENRIESGLPDVLGADRARYANRRTLVVGRGYSAATTLCALAELAQQEPQTQVVWMTRGAPGEGIEEAPPESGTPPLERIANDRLPQRDDLAERANRLATEESCVDYRPGVRIESVQPDGEQLIVSFAGRSAGQETFDQVVANVGYRPDRSIYRELQVHECYASEGPMKLAAQLLGQTSVDCLDQTSTGSASLCSPEANFYILGAKSYGRSSQFLYSQGLAQIRDLFRLIGDRESLDLYSGPQKFSS